MPYTQADRHIAIETTLGDDVLLLRSLRGHEALGASSDSVIDGSPEAICRLRSAVRAASRASFTL